MKFVKTKKAFTMIEMLLAISVFSIVMVIVFGMYSSMVRLKYNIQAKQNLLESSYFVIERLNVLLRDYTIDYEEYFNRSAIGCSDTSTFDDFEWDVDYCKNFTAYGNSNNFLSDTGVFVNYYCSSLTGEDFPLKVYKNVNLFQGSGCYQSQSLPGRQSYGQYKYQFRDMKGDADYRPGVVNDDDDENLGLGPKAIYDQDKVKELYLISQDKTKRLLLRRKMVASGDFNGSGGIGDIDNEKLYTIQVLKLRGFDAGARHNFDIKTSTGIYDSRIDTWACDYSQGFDCNGAPVGNNIYSGYRLPLNQDDGWQNLFDSNLTIVDWNMTISPTKDPNYSFNDNNAQMNPYFTLSFNSKLYGGIRWTRLKKNIETFQLNLKTTLNTRNFYTK